VTNYVFSASISSFVEKQPTVFNFLATYRFLISTNL
jgi:hypothetical protein